MEIPKLQSPKKLPFKFNQLNFSETSIYPRHRQREIEIISYFNWKYCHAHLQIKDIGRQGEQENI